MSFFPQLQTRDMTSNQLSAEPLESVPRFNWLFLVELIVCGILVLFFLFYFNRLFATLVSYGIRAYTWHYYRVYVDLHALQISLLGGRIFFKGLRYHGENETVLVHSGYVTWRYWLRSVKLAGLFNDNEATPYPPDRHSGEPPPNAYEGHDGPSAKTSQAPCRLEITLQGLEWFIYNRSPAYDSIVSGFPRSDSDGRSDRGQNEEDDEKTKNGEHSSSDANIRETDEAQNIDSAMSSESRTSQQKGASVVESVAKVLKEMSSSSGRSSNGNVHHDTNNDEASQSQFLTLLPIRIHCNKGAIVIGNENTKSILTATYDKASGEIDAKKAGPLDLYKQAFDFDFSHPVIQLKPNPDFRHSQLAAARASATSGSETSQQHRNFGLHWRYQRRKQKMWHSIRDLIPYFQTSVESFHPSLSKPRASQSTYQGISGLPGGTRWAGLTRYLDEEDQDEHEGWNSVEYGRFSTILDCPSLLASYHWDTPGKVTSDRRSSVLRVSQDINGAEPPDWGLHLTIKGGNINYGPWADRERACFQSILFPSPYRDSQPAATLAPGAPRECTKFRLTIDIQDDMTLRVPTREPSKDWLWKGRAHTVKRRANLKKKKEKKHPRDSETDKGSHSPDIRPFGWFSLRIGDKSTLKYEMDMVTSDEEYHNRLDIHLLGSRMTSSINHGLLWESDKQTISCDLSNPLKWNRGRTWNFNVNSQGLDLFLLREHIYLLTDMMNDWTSGPSPDFHVFVPFQYNMSFTFDDFRLFMNLNDSNIINNPSDTDDNTFLIIKGENLQSNVGIPAATYRPNRNTIPFDVNIMDGDIELSTPLWNTHRSFMKDRSVGSLKTLALKGTYTYYMATSPTLTDIVTLDIDGDLPQLHNYGFIIRYFLNIKDNYFGEHQHFKTLEEFQELLKAEEAPAGSGGNPNRKTNDLDVILHIRGENPNVLIPASIYGNRDDMKLQAAFLEADVRFTNYYMDIEVFFSPLEAFLETLEPDGSRTTSMPQLFIDGLRIHGHRLFGLPPTEPTYVCNWDFEVGKIIGECSPAFLKCATSAMRFVGFSIDDEENALPPIHPTILPDVTFVRATLQSIDIWILEEKSAVLVSTTGFDFDFNDWAGRKLSKRLNMCIPDLIFCVVDKDSALRMQELNQPARTQAYFQTTVKLKLVERDYDFAASRALQQQHVRMHDNRTNRTPWLLLPQDQSGLSLEKQDRNKALPAAMPLPTMPEPTRGVQIYRSSSLTSSSSSTRGGPDLSCYDENAYQNQNGNTRSNPLVSGKSARSDDSILKRRPPGAWVPPSFRFYGVRPDIRLVPSLSPARRSSGKSQDKSKELDFGYESDSEKASQVYINCELDQGLTGYSSPEAIFAFSALLAGLQPSHPVEVIDSLQASVIPDILGHEKRLKSPRKVLNASLRVPICRMKLVTHSTSLDEVSFQDEYSAELCDIQAFYRGKSETKDHAVQPISQGATTHIAVDSVSVSARGETTDTLDLKGTFHSKLEGVVFRSVSEPTKEAQLRLQHLEALTFNESIEGLALLAERANKLIDSVALSFKQASTSRTNRLHSLVYFLTKHGSQTSDPLFLTRASYVLRAAGEHLRLNNSWKIISRLRNIYNSLPRDQKAELTLGCLNNTITCPSDGRSFVLSNFDKWRTWDLAHVKKSYVMNVIWGGSGSGQSKKLDSETNSLLLSIETFWLSVDPGPRENGFLVEDLSLRVNQKGWPHDQVSSAPSTETSISVQSSCSNVSLRIKWEVCRLIESVLKITSRSDPRPSGVAKASNGKDSRKSNPDIHIAFVSNCGNIELDGINLKLNLASERFKASIIHQSSGPAAQDTLNFVISSDSSSTELTSRSTLLMSSKFVRPNIFLSHTSGRNGSLVEHDWKCTAACQKLRYDMMEDPIGILHVADRVVEDELKYILDVGKTLGSSGPNKEKEIPLEDRAIHHVRIVTFLNDYQLRISLLPSVFYFITGEEASLSVAPASELKVEIDFDTKNSLHELHSDKDGTQRVISSVVIPPINGRVLIDSLHYRTALDVDLTVELINVEAGSIRNLLAAVDGPEISHFLSDVSDDAQALKYHLDQILSRGSKSTSAEEPAKSREFVYKLRLTLAGIYVHSRAPGLRNKEYSADLNFNLGMIQVHVENAPNGGTMLVDPDFEVSIHEIRFGLLKRQQEDVQPCGSLVLYARLSGSSHTNKEGETIRSYHLSSDGLEIELFAETASMMIDIVAHLQKRLKSLDLSQDVKHLRKLRLLQPPEKMQLPQVSVDEGSDRIDHKKLFNAMYSVELSNLQLTWFISKEDVSADKDAEDLVFSIKRIDLATRKDNAARLRIEGMQLQMIPILEDRKQRSQNSALLPEVVFNVAYLSTHDEHRLAFHAAGKALDLRITSDSILPASLLQTSLASASANLREANVLWRENMPSSDKKKQKASASMKRLGSLLVDADFAGAVVSLRSRHSPETNEFVGKRGHKANLGGKYGQYIPQDVTAATAKLQAPGVALKVQFEDTGTHDPTLNAEVKVDASTNLLHPTVVPLVTQISSSVKEVVGEDEDEKESTDKTKPHEKALQGNPIGANDPTTILGRCKLNVGLRICKQEFTLSCQPIARVAATARFEDSYITVNTVQSEEKRRFFAVLVAFNSLQLSIKHVYSSESTANFEIESIVMSLMNSKHVSSSAGISAILKISPTKIYGNAKQAQDFLLFREIWIPPDDSPRQPKSTSSSDAQAFVVQRYRQMASAGAFPWDSTIAVDDLNVQLDLGQTVGKSDFTIRNLWLSSKKSSDWEQNLCFGFDSVTVESKGRLSGFVELSQVKLRTSIMWPDEEPTEEQTPLIQASLGFSQVQAKVSFEYQPFLVADITSFEFLMYNVRHASGDQNDRLVSNVEGDKFQVFCTALSASQGVALYQTLQRLVQDKQAAYTASLKEIESFLRRKTSTTGEGTSALTFGPTGKDETGESDEDKMPISLHTDVVVTLRAINIGAFPSTFHDGQIFKLEALGAEARFTVAAAEGRIHGGLTLTLGQLRVALSGVKRPNEPDPEELSVSDVVSRATGSRGGTILKVPRVVVSMETWQTPTSPDIDYIFKSLFEGRVDVGWNYSRISFIRGMWTNHSRTLANRLGKPLHQTAVKITGGPKEGEEGEYSGHEKITAVVNVPQSRYIYTPLESPVIETPQLRDMGEATPPLEWIGLNREKLPNLTHQIVMVTLMEVAKDVEDAYFKILGS